MVESCGCIILVAVVPSPFVEKDGVKADSTDSIQTENKRPTMTAKRLRVIAARSTNRVRIEVVRASMCGVFEDDAVVAFNSPAFVRQALLTWRASVSATVWKFWRYLTNLRNLRTIRRNVRSP
jgi:hypothetical protein